MSSAQSCENPLLSHLKSSENSDIIGNSHGMNG